MSFKYIKALDCIVVKNENEVKLINATYLRQFCKKYGIPMYTYKDLIQYLSIPNAYLPKEIYGYL